METRSMDAGSTPRPRAGHTRSAILDAARSCFADKGFAGTSMDRIAAEAGVTKPTVYAHFGTKAGLFEQLIKDELTSQSTHPTPPVSSTTDVATDLYELCRDHLDWLLAETRIGLLRAAAPETIRRPDWAASLLEGIETSSLAVWLEDLNEAGIMAVADPTEAARMHLATLKGALFYPALLGLIPIAEPDERDRVARMSTDLFLAAFPPVDHS